MQFAWLWVNCNRKFLEYTSCNSYPVFGRSNIELVAGFAGCGRGCQWASFEVAMVGTRVLYEMADRRSDQIRAMDRLPAPKSSEFVYTVYGCSKRLQDYHLLSQVLSQGRSNLARFRSVSSSRKSLLNRQISSEPPIHEQAVVERGQLWGNYHCGLPRCSLYCCDSGQWSVVSGQWSVVSGQTSTSSVERGQWSVAKGTSLDRRSSTAYGAGERRRDRELVHYPENR
jgi:hypothetical protein